MKIEIELPNKDKLVAEIIEGNKIPEIFIGVEDEDGYNYQDLAVVGSYYEYNGLKCKVHDDKYRVWVWTDGHSDDCKECFDIDRVREP